MANASVSKTPYFPQRENLPAAYGACPLFVKLEIPQKKKGKERKRMYANEKTQKQNEKFKKFLQKKSQILLRCGIM
jgi:hypothetical protein